MYNKSKEKRVPVTKPTSKIPKPVTKETAVGLPAIRRDSGEWKQTTKERVPLGGNIDSKKSGQSRNTASHKKMVAAKRPPSYQKGGKAGGKVDRPAPKGFVCIPLNLLLAISEYCCLVPFDVYKLSLVCSTWRQLMDTPNAIFFWKRFKKTSEATCFQQFKSILVGNLNQLKQKRSIQFETMYTKLFNYGSTKQNIPNKLISKLKLQLEVVVNGKKRGNYPFKLRHFNFSSYLYAKITELADIKFDMYTPHNMFKDKLKIGINFYSRTYKVAYQLQYEFTPQEIADCAIKQKAFNYFLSKNLVITFFEGDNNFLYSFLQFSLLELITEFRKVIKRDFKVQLDKNKKKLPMYKQLCETEFQNLVEYVKYQADFQLHLSYHNSIEQIYTHCDTKVYPCQYDKKQAYFQVPIDDTFQKTSTFLLDNKMGMAEPIHDLYLLDFVLKDRDRFLIVFSGFIYARKATQKERQSIENYFEFAEAPIKILQFKNKQYEFCITIVEETKKNLIKSSKFRIFA